MIKGIIFDWDGVLVDSISAHYNFMRDHAIRLGMDFNFTWPEFKMLAASPMDNFLRNAEFPENELESIVQMYKETLPRMHMPFYAGVIDTVRKLGQKYKLGIASSNSEEIVKAKILEGGLEDCFRSIVTKETVKRPKPDPECIELNLDTMGIHNYEAVFVGDLPADIHAGKNAGVKSIGVSYGWGDETQLRELNVPIINCFECLPSLIESIISHRTAKNKSEIVLVTADNHPRFGQVAEHLGGYSPDWGFYNVKFEDGIIEEVPDGGPHRPVCPARFFSKQSDGVFRNNGENIVDAYKSLGVGDLETLHKKCRMVFGEEIVSQKY